MTSTSAPSLASTKTLTDDELSVPTLHYFDYFVLGWPRYTHDAAPIIADIAVKDSGTPQFPSSLQVDKIQCIFETPIIEAIKPLFSSFGGWM